MTRARCLVIQFLSITGWYAVWGWVIADPLWGWVMPWELLRWPLTTAVALLTGLPLARWLDRPANKSEEK